MNSLIKNWMPGLLLAICILAGTGNTSAQSRASISYQTFYNELEPYGRWISHRDFGRVWVPRAERDFQPYSTRGRWVITEFGNTWVSDYEWGWAPFHYGQWFYDDFMGWAWVPGQEWSPAWVDWRSGNGYYGWAPIAPSGRGRYNIPQHLWVFVPQRHICSRNVFSYHVPRTQVVRIYRNTTIINNYYTNNNRRYASGPGVNEIERATRSRVKVYDVHSADRPGRTYTDNNSIRVYRPDNQDRRYNDQDRTNSAGRNIENQNYTRNDRNNSNNSNYNPG